MLEILPICPRCSTTAPTPSCHTSFSDDKPPDKPIRLEFELANTFSFPPINTPLPLVQPAPHRRHHGYRSGALRYLCIRLHLCFIAPCATCALQSTRRTYQFVDKQLKGSFTISMATRKQNSIFSSWRCSVDEPMDEG